MAGISSSIGILSGIKIEDTVNQLIAVSSQPKNILTDRTKLLQSEQAAVTQLTSLLVAFQFESNQLGVESLFQSKQVVVQQLGGAHRDGQDRRQSGRGNYAFTPVQTAAAQQFLSQSFGATEAVGAGSFTFQVGGFVDQGISLDELNSGDGVQRGKIRVTDRTGDTATIDLSFARTIDDVLAAINDNSEINVTASIEGDRIKLTDNTGGTGNLVVKDVGGGTTAAGPGTGRHQRHRIARPRAPTSSRSTRGPSSRRSTTARACESCRTPTTSAFSLADGTTLTVNLDGALNLGDVITKINAASPAQALGGDRRGRKSARVEGSHDRRRHVRRSQRRRRRRRQPIWGSPMPRRAAPLPAAGWRLACATRCSPVSTADRGSARWGRSASPTAADVASSVNLASAETLGDVISAINTQATGVKAASTPRTAGSSSTTRPAPSPAT